MKKIAMMLVILLGLTMGAFAQGGGLFGMGSTKGGDMDYKGEPMISLPTAHGSSDDHGAPLGSGIVVLAGLGAAYLATKKNNKE
jgi:hypothetical protein